MDLRHLIAGLVVLAVPVCAASCSDSAVTSTPTSDVDGGKKSSEDGGDPLVDEDGGDLPGDDGGNPGTDGGPKPDSGPGPAGVQLKAGTISLLGVTTDDNVVYVVQAGATASLEAVPIAGGAPVVLAATIAQTDQILVTGKTVALWAGINATTQLGTLSVWTKATGVKAVGPNSVVGMFAASDDAARIAYSINATATAKDILIGNPALSPASTSIVTNVGIGCNPVILFAGQRPFTSTCAGAATTATVRTFTAANTVQSLQATATPGFLSVSTTGDKAFVKSSAKASPIANVKTIPATGAATTTAFETGVLTGVMFPDGANVLYQTDAMGLKRSPTAAFTPVTLVPAGVRFLLDYTKDVSFALVQSNPDDTANTNVARYDVQLVSTAAAGALIPLVATSIGNSVGFTANGSHAVYLTDLPATGNPSGTLKARATAAGGVDTEIAKGALLPAMIRGTAKVAFLDNPQTVGQAIAVDLKVADVAGAGAPTLVAAQVEPTFMTTATNAIYTTPAGLYAKALP